LPLWNEAKSAAGADIEGILAAVNRSHRQMQEVQDKQVQIVEDLRLAVLHRFQQIRETLGDKIDNAALKMRDMGRKQIQQHLADLHWASLRATINHQGFWTTRNGRLGESARCHGWRNHPAGSPGVVEAC
jgi:hypothetical protein